MVTLYIRYTCIFRNNRLFCVF